MRTAGLRFRVHMPTAVVAAGRLRVRFGEGLREDPVVTRRRRAPPTAPCPGAGALEGVSRENLSPQRRQVTERALTLAGTL